MAGAPGPVTSPRPATTVLAMSGEPGGAAGRTTGPSGGLRLAALRRAFGALDRVADPEPVRPAVGGAGPAAPARLRPHRPRRHRARLVVHDRQDKEVPHADGVRVAGTWPAGTLVSTEGLGHRRLLCDPGVVDTVTRFVTSGGGEDDLPAR